MIYWNNLAVDNFSECNRQTGEGEKEVNSFHARSFLVISEDIERTEWNASIKWVEFYLKIIFDWQHRDVLKWEF